MSLFYCVHKSNKALALLLLTTALFSCSSEKERSSKIDYLGQKPPGMKAELFAPGIISTDSYEHSAPAFSPDGKVVLWTVLDKSFRSSFLEMKYEQGKWIGPYRPSFGDSTSNDHYPFFSSDGKMLYFSSRRKVPEGYLDRGNRIWQVKRNGDEWGDPMPFDTTVSRGSDLASSITDNGTMYFSSAIIAQTDWSILRSEKINGSYTKPVLLPFNINSIAYEDGPFIAPDESFLIFESRRPEGIDGSVDLYIAFKNRDDRWSAPLNMGPQINSDFGERFARLSPDGKYLFFGSGRSGIFDIYWIDARIIDELRNNATEQNIIETPLGEEILSALDKKDFENASELLKQWLSFHPNHLDAMLIYSSVLRKLNRFPEAEKLLAAKTSDWNENVSFVLEMALVKLGMNKNQEADKLLAPILIEGEHQYYRYKSLAESTFEMEKFKISDEYFEKAMTIDPDRNDYYNRACAYALIGEKNKAFENLNKAVEHGYNSKSHIESDTDLQSLKSDSRFQKLLLKLK